MTLKDYLSQFVEYKTDETQEDVDGLDEIMNDVKNSRAVKDEYSDCI